MDGSHRRRKFRDWGNYLTEVVVLFGGLGIVLLAVAVTLLVRFLRPPAL